MFVAEHLLHRAGEASENLALTRNREPIASPQSTVGMPAEIAKDSSLPSRSTVGVDWSHAFRLRTQIAFAKGSKMFGPKTELRVSVALLLAALTFAAPGLPVSAAQSDYSNSLTFITSKFVAGKTLDGFSAGTPDYGFTMEAMLQRKALGQKLVDQLTAVKANLADTVVFAKSAVANYAYSLDSTLKTIKPGLAGKFLFVSSVLGVPNAPLRNGLISDLKKAIASNGAIAAANANTFEYSWAILGLATNNQPKLANLAAQKLTSLERPDGGFGTDQTGNTFASSADATGIALQALTFCKRSASPAQLVKLKKSIASASAYLRSTQVTGDHWEAFGDVDVNGTAYASMGLKAAGGNVATIQLWLKARIAPTGGLTTSWSNGSGDIFATAQGMVAVMGLSYLDLVAK